jgi:hypothetical protein
MRPLLVALAFSTSAAMAIAAPALSPPEIPGPIVRVQAAPMPPASPDDVDFLFRMGLMEGHLMVAHDLLQAKKAQMAQPHFGHPVRELYDDVSSYLKKKQFPAFNRQLVALEAAATTAPYAKDTEAKYQAVIQTIHKARDLAPASLRASVPDMLKICATTIDTASGEYNGAIERGRVTQMVEYHDSRGFITYVAQQLKSMTGAAADADADAQGMLDRFRTVLVKAEWIVEPLIPAAKPRATVAEYRAIANEAVETTKPN